MHVLYKRVGVTVVYVGCICIYAWKSKVVVLSFRSFLPPYFLNQISKLSPELTNMASLASLAAPGIH